ncbi:MAG: hypothetical protein ACI88A_001009 [Paraglaciecola sp.]
MTAQTKSTGKRTMLILAIVFIVPIVLAKLALENDWFNRAASNLGELITPPLDMSILQGPSDTPKWRILYLLPEVCDARCENAIYSLSQVHKALGVESTRVESIVISTETSHADEIQSLQKHTNIKLLKSNVESVKQVFKDQRTDVIFVADTLNNVILRYALYSDAQESVLHSRDILLDLKRLLKLSRIG